jgi:hypothetical protein
VSERIVIKLDPDQLAVLCRWTHALSGNSCIGDPEV